MGGRTSQGPNAAPGAEKAPRAVAQKKCKGMTRDGKPCNCPAVGESGYCVFHDPALADKAKAWRTAGKTLSEAHPDPGKRPSTGMRTDTPLRAMRCYCIDCVSSMHDIADCQGDFVLGTGEPCPLYPWRFGCRPETAAARGHDVSCDSPRREPLKAIRAECLACCCGSGKEVGLCPSDGTTGISRCPLWPYRFGMGPATARKRGKQVDLEMLEVG